MSHAIVVKPSARKAATRESLSGLAIKLSDGSDYHLQDSLRPGATLLQVRDALRHIEEPLADVVTDERRLR